MAQKATSTAQPTSGGLLENVKTIVYALLIAIGIRTVAFEPFNIPSASMVPTLLIGDYLFVSKYSYGYSTYSLWPSMHLFSGRIFGRVPERGDVAVFRWPANPKIDYIKRIVGLPGDRIQMKAGQLYINGTLVPRVAAGTVQALEGEGEGMVMVDSKLYHETLPNGREHDIAKKSDLASENPLNDTQEFRVPEGRVFAMGDNRDNSSDSRAPNGGVGYIPLENMVGRAEFIFFSFEPTEPWWKVWKWPSEVRWSRLLHGIS